MDSAKLETATSILAKSFIDEPSLVWTFPNESSRPGRLSWLFRRDLTAIVRTGGWIDLDSDVNPRGAAVWLSGASPYIPLFTELAAGFWAAPFVFGLAATQRLIQLSDYHAHWRKKAVPGPHLFLALLGVLPEAQGQGLARILLDRGLAHADKAGWPAALETQTEKNVTLYEHFGFELLSSEPLAKGGPRCYAMVRPACTPKD